MCIRELRPSVSCASRARGAGARVACWRHADNAPNDEDSGHSAQDRHHDDDDVVRVLNICRAEPSQAPRHFSAPGATTPLSLAQVLPSTPPAAHHLSPVTAQEIAKPIIFTPPYPLSGASPRHLAGGGGRRRGSRRSWCNGSPSYLDCYVGREVARLGCGDASVVNRPAVTRQSARAQFLQSSHEIRLEIDRLELRWELVKWRVKGSGWQSAGEEVTGVQSRHALVC